MITWNEARAAVRMWWHRLRRRSTVVDRGMVYGWLTHSDHIETALGCVRLSADMSVFHRLITSGGLAYGQITSGFHPSFGAKVPDVVAAYDTVRPIACVRAEMVGSKGIWLEGAITDEIPDGPLMLSGDWRSLPMIDRDGLVLLGIILVHDSGFGR